MKKKLVSGLLVAAMSLSMLAGSIVSFADEATDAVLKDGDTTEIDPESAGGAENQSRGTGRTERSRYCGK